jgi:hypothetical protein
VRFTGTGKARVIEQVDRDVAGWVGEVAGAPVWLERPREHKDERGVGVYLLELDAQPAGREPGRAPLQIQLRYLVTTWAPALEEEHRLLSELVFAALGRPDWEVALRPLDAPGWAAFGLAPRPAVLLRVPLRLERPARVAPRVRTALRIETAASRTLAGRVLGPGDVAVAGARVEAPALGAAAETDWDGRFRLGRVPAAPHAALRVSAKGRVKDIEAELPADGAELILRLDLGEA